MQNPMIFGANGNTLLGGGEAGAEAILPLAEFYNYLTSLLDRKMAQMTGQQYIVEVHNYIDGEEVSSHTYVKVKEKLAKDYKSRK